MPPKSLYLSAFKPAGVAIYQLGNFGTASKKLKEWNLNQLKRKSVGPFDR